jgi:hypothetical protein
MEAMNTFLVDNTMPGTDRYWVHHIEDMYVKLKPSPTSFCQSTLYRRKRCRLESVRSKYGSKANNNNQLCYWSKHITYIVIHKCFLRPYLTCHTENEPTMIEEKSVCQQAEPKQRAIVHQIKAWSVSILIELIY